MHKRGTRTVLTLLATVLAFALAACGSDATSSVNEDKVIGTYVLSTINNKPLPAVIDEGVDSKREVVTSVIHLNEGRKCRVDFTYRDTSNGAVTTSEHQNPCTFLVNGTTLTMMLTEVAAEQVATISGSTIRVVDPAGEWVFAKDEPLD